MSSWSQWGDVGFANSMAGGCGLLALMFVIFSFSGGGAGDVKLVACLGALLGWEIGLTAVLHSFIVAGAVLICYSIWSFGPAFIARTLGRSVLHGLLPHWTAAPVSSQDNLLKKQFPLAPFFACGTMLTLCFPNAV